MLSSLWKEWRLRKRKYNVKVRWSADVNLRRKNVRSWSYILLSEKLKSSKREEATFYRQWSAYNWTGSFTCKDIEVYNHDTMCWLKRRKREGIAIHLSSWRSKKKNRLIKSLQVFLKNSCSMLMFVDGKMDYVHNGIIVMYNVTYTIIIIIRWSKLKDTHYTRWR